MNSHPQSENDSALAPVVHAVLSQIAKRRLAGLISAKEFDVKVKRLEREELEPQGLRLLVRPLAQGGIRFVVKVHATGRTCDIMDQCSVKGVNEPIQQCLLDPAVPTSF